MNKKVINIDFNKVDVFIHKTFLIFFDKIFYEKKLCSTIHIL